MVYAGNMLLFASISQVMVIYVRCVAENSTRAWERLKLFVGFLRPHDGCILGCHGDS
jgi:hypothetical protein